MSQCYSSYNYNLQGFIQDFSFGGGGNSANFFDKKRMWPLAAGKNFNFATRQ